MSWWQFVVVMWGVASTVLFTVFTTCLVEGKRSEAWLDGATGAAVGEEFAEAA
jgi:hypothetical protein